MSFFEEITAIEDVQLLEQYINSNSVNALDFFNQDYEVLFGYHEAISAYVLLNPAFRLLKGDSSLNATFLINLFDYFERIFPRIDCCKTIHYKLIESDVDIGRRLEAASLFLFVPDNSAYISRYEEIIDKLHYASCNEVENIELVLMTFASYFASVLINPSPIHNTYIVELRNKIIESRQSKKYFFLDHDFVDLLLAIKIDSPKEGYSDIHELIDNLKKSILPLKVDTEEYFIIENDTEYAKNIEQCNANFDIIRSISTKALRTFENKDEIFYSLVHGVAVLQEEAQMYSYMNGLGNTHKTKLITAYQPITIDMFDKNVELFDWGCGQGIASMTFLENYPDLLAKIERIILIEPSEICLKRSALHVRKYKKDALITTINKDINSINKKDFITTKKNIKVHLFSNILDIFKFSMTKLLDFITNTFDGHNVFICVSPFVSVVSTQRIDSFVNYFEDTFPDSYIQLLKKSASKHSEYWNCNHNFRYGYVPCDKDKHGELGCKDKWTNVIRVFKVDL